MHFGFEYKETASQIEIVDKTLPLRLGIFLLFTIILFYTENSGLALTVFIGLFLLLLLLNFKAVRQIIVSRFKQGYQIKGYAFSRKNPITITIKK